MGLPMDTETLNEILLFVESNFEVTSKIVESGQRIVYLARNIKETGAQFVLKICPVYPANVARIQRELKILSEIDSLFFPKSIYSKYVSNEKINYFLENLDPMTQREKINYLLSLDLSPFLITVEEFIPHLKWPEFESRIKTERDIVNLLKQIFSALNLLWDKKIVHRDLKPDNILIRENMSPVIIDLGIAKSLREGTRDITQPFVSTPCTPQFAAPEQLINSKAEITYKSDQFSIGVYAYFLLTGVFPFGNLEELGPEYFLKNIVNNNIAYIKQIKGDISDGLAEFIHRLLKVNPYQRFRNYENIKKELETLGGKK